MQVNTQLDLIADYFDLYYECVPELAKSLPESKLRHFVKTCNPVARGAISDQAKLKHLEQILQNDSQLSKNFFLKNFIQI